MRTTECLLKCMWFQTTTMRAKGTRKSWDVSRPGIEWIAWTTLIFSFFEVNQLNYKLPFWAFQIGIMKIRLFDPIIIKL